MGFKLGEYAGKYIILIPYFVASISSKGDLWKLALSNNTICPYFKFGNSSFINHKLKTWVSV